MKTALLIACASLGLAGCTTCDYGNGGTHTVVETSAGRGGTGTVVETSVVQNGSTGTVIVQSPPTHKHHGSSWANGYQTDPDLLAPRLQLDPLFPPAPPL
jgi:hypothetical protein